MELRKRGNFAGRN